MMSNVIEVGFGKKPPKEVNGEKAVTLESNFYPFECPFIGSHGVITQFFKEGKTDMTIARGRSGPDIGISTDFLRRLTKNFSPLNIGDLVVFDILPDQSIGPVAIRRLDAVSSNIL